MTQTVEDILEKTLSSINLTLPDKTILFSIARQVKKNVGLTDRQYALVKEKLSYYRDDLKTLGVVDLDEALNNLKLPLRSVDRSKVITVVDGKEIGKLENKSWIEIKFPFNKKTITLIGDIAKKNKTQYHHVSGSSSHYFKLNETTVEEVVDRFADKNFSIDQQLIDFNNRVKEIKMRKEDHIPGVYNNQLLNFRPAAISLIQSELGELTEENKIKFYDRRRRYGIAHIECNRPTGILGDIVFRENQGVGFDPDSVSIQSVADAVAKLDRFPLIVLVDIENALEQVQQVHSSFSHYVENKYQSVLFRVDNTTEYTVNNYIKDNQLNNWVDNNTKIVYINRDKLPKVLVRSSWQPMSALQFSAERTNSYVSMYVSSFADLIMCVSKDYEKFGRKINNGFVL